MNTDLQTGQALPPDVAASMAAISQHPEPGNSAPREALQGWMSALDNATATADLARMGLALVRAIDDAYRAESRARHDDARALVQVAQYLFERTAVVADTDLAHAQTRVDALCRQEGGA